MLYTGVQTGYGDPMLRRRSETKPTLSSVGAATTRPVGVGGGNGACGVHLGLAAPAPSLFQHGTVPIASTLHAVLTCVAPVFLVR